MNEMSSNQGPPMGRRWFQVFLIVFLTLVLPQIFVPSWATSESGAAPLEGAATAGKTVYKDGESTAASTVAPGDPLDYVLDLGTGDTVADTSGTISLHDMLAGFHSGVTAPQVPAGWSAGGAAVPGADSTIATYDLAANRPGTSSGTGANAGVLTPAPFANEATGVGTVAAATGPGAFAVTQANMDGWVPFTYINGQGRQDVLTISHKSFYGACWTALTFQECTDLDSFVAPNSGDTSGPNATWFRQRSAMERDHFIEAGNYVVYAGSQGSAYCLDVSGPLPTTCVPTAADVGWSALGAYRLPQAEIRGMWRVGNYMYAYATDSTANVAFHAWDLSPSLAGTGLPAYVGSEIFSTPAPTSASTLVMSTARVVPFTEVGSNRLVYATQGGRAACVEFTASPSAGDVVSDCSTGTNTLSLTPVSGVGTLGFVTPIIDGWIDNPTDSEDPVGIPNVVGSCVWSSGSLGVLACFDENMNSITRPAYPAGFHPSLATEYNSMPHTNNLIAIGDWQVDTSVRCFDTQTGQSCGLTDAAPGLAGNVILPYGSEWLTDTCLVFFGDAGRFSLLHYEIDANGNYVWTAGCAVGGGLPPQEFSVADPAPQYCAPATTVGTWDRVDLAGIPPTTDSSIEFYAPNGTLIDSATFSNPTSGGGVSVPIPTTVDYGTYPSIIVRIVWSSNTVLNGSTDYNVTVGWTTTDGSGPQVCFQATVDECPAAAGVLNTMSIESSSFEPFASNPFVADVAAPVTGAAVTCTVTVSGTLFADPDGLTDGTVNGSGINPGGAFATLLDASGNVVASVPVASDGTYAFEGVAPYADYTLQISVTDETAQVGGPPSTGPSLPAGWKVTGDNLGAGAGNDGSADGSLAVTVRGANVVEANVGINQPPTAEDVAATAVFNPGGAVRVATPELVVSDPEDGVPTTVTIVTLPTNGDLFYDGARVTAGQVIADFDPALLVLDPHNGPQTVQFTYTTTDSAGLESAPATVTMPFIDARLELVKSVVEIVDNGDGLVGAGDTVRYAFRVTNRGETPLADVTIDDARLGLVGVACATDLAPGQGANCPTFDYELVEGDLIDGGVENSATATAVPVDSAGEPFVDANTGLPVQVTDVSDAGTAPDGVVEADPAGTETDNPLGVLANNPDDPGDDPTTVRVAAKPAIELIKSIDRIEDLGSPGTSVGDIIHYDFKVTNTGNVTLTNVVVSDSLADVTGGPLGSLAPGAFDDATFHATYTIDQTDIDRDGVENTALVEADPPGGRTISDVSDAGTGVDGVPVGVPGRAETGNPLGINPNDPDDPTDDPTTLSFQTSPSIALVKSVVSIDDLDGNGPDVGDLLRYSFAVTNTGDVTLTDVTVTDEVATVLGGPVRSLAPRVTDDTTFTGTYELTDADIGRRGVENTATVSGSHGSQTVTDVSDTGTKTDGSPVSDPQGTETDNPLDVFGNTSDPGDDPTTWLLPTGGSISLVKSVSSIEDLDRNGVGAGDVIHYSFVVTNTGTTTLRDISVSDPKLSVLGGPLAMLTPGASDGSTFTGEYVISDADVLGGGVENVASVTALDPVRDRVSASSDAGTAPDGSPVIDPPKAETPSPLGEADNDPGDPGDDPTTVTLTPTPALTIVKALDRVEDVDGNGTDAGDVLHYSFVVTNSGNVTLSDVTVTDPLAVVKGGPLDTLGVGESDGDTFTATYVLRDQDIMAGGFENTAQASGITADDQTVTDRSDTSTDPAGQPIGSPATTETDNPLGGLDNQPNDPTDDPTTFVVVPNPGIDLVKSIATVDDGNKNGIDAGDIVRYRFVVTNVGNVGLTDVVVTDPKVRVAGGPVASLAAGESTDAFTATYTLTQADIDAGGFENTAVTQGKAPGGVVVTDISDTGTNSDLSAISNPAGTETPNPLAEAENDAADPTDDPTTLLIESKPELDLRKSLASIDDVNDNGLDAGDELNYAFTVTNTGNVTLTNVVVTDSKAKVRGGPIASLAPGKSDSVTFTATYAITEADLVAEGVDNSAVATGSDPAGTEVTDISDTGTQSDGSAVDTPATTETPSLGDEYPNRPDNPGDDPTPVALVRTPAIELVKSLDSVEDLNDDGVGIGDLVHYRFAVTNVGNVPLNDVQVTDPKLTVEGGPVAALNAGETDSTTFVGSYKITEADVAAGAVENVAKVDAVAKTLEGQAVSATSDSGTAPDGSEITDPGKAETPNPLGEFPNDASIPGDDPTTVLIARAPAISIVKSMVKVEDNDKNGEDPGDVVHYAFKVTNTGNVTLSNVKVVDPTATVKGGPLASLAPGQTDSDSFTATYVLTEDDFIAGRIENVATAVGTDPTGAPVEDDSDTGTTVERGDVADPGSTETPTPGSQNPNDPKDPGDDPTVIKLTMRPELTVLKSAVSATDKTIVFEITATNSGNVTLTDVAISDPKAGISNAACASTLEVGKSCSVKVDYEITAADRQARKVENTATGSASDPKKQPVTDRSDTGTDVTGNVINDPAGTDNDGDKAPGNDATVISVPEDGAPSLGTAPRPSSGPQRVAFTGAAIAGLLLISMVSIALGVALVFGVRRRNRI